MISYIKKFSLNEYKGKIACVVYMQGCNLSCSYCFNKELISKKNNNPVSLLDYRKFLEHRKNKLNAVVFSGGEPLIHDELSILCQIAKCNGYAIKLYTNGTIYDNLIKVSQYIDSYCMSIKKTYPKHLIDDVKKSIEFIKNYDHEFVKVSCGV